MKILHIENGRNFYGGPQQVLYLCSGLDQKGIKNIVICHPESFLKNQLEKIGIKVIGLACKSDFDLIFALNLYKIIRREKPDIIHCHSRKGADFLSGFIAKSMSVSNVLSRRVDSYEPNIISKIRCSLFKKIIAISKKIYDETSEVGIDKNKLALIKSAVDLNQLSNQESKSVFLEKFNLEDDDFVIATVGQLIPRKGHEQLIEIFSELKRSNSRIKLLVFGQGKLEAHLRKISAENNLSKSIKFCGFLYDLDNYFSHFDLVVHCAVREGLGVSLLKAAAVGVPIVAFRTGGIPEVVDHKETGLLSELGDKESLQKNIEYFIVNKKFRLTCSINAKEWIKNQFSIDEMIDKHTKLYENLI